MTKATISIKTFFVAFAFAAICSVATHADDNQAKPASDKNQPASESKEQGAAVDRTAAENYQPAKGEPSTNLSPPEWHRARMRLSGSLCLSCLKELEASIKKLPGVNGLKTQRASEGILVNVSPEIGSWAETVIVFDAHKLSIDELRSALKKSGYAAFHLSDKPLMRDPDDRDLKL